MTANGQCRIRFLPAENSRRGDLPPFILATPAERDEVLARWAEACDNLGIRHPREGTDYVLEELR